MAITCTPLITDIINEARVEITMSVEIDDGKGDIRTLSSTGKAKTIEEGRRLMDSIIDRYKTQIAHEVAVQTIKTEMETDAKTYLEAQLNG